MRDAEGERMGAKKTLRQAVALALAGMLALAGCSSSGAAASGKDASSLLDPADPVQIELWTYYNGTQQQAFESLVDEFNATRGKSVGVVVTGSSQGGVNDLAAAVTGSAQGLVGYADMPDAFLSYPDTASLVDSFGRVADLSGYLTDEQKDQYVEAFLAEGDLDGTGSLKVFPVAKSTETFQMNLTDWRVFADATGSTLDELATVEGIVAVSQRYYEWTDAQTPDVPNDGRAFFGRDALTNYLVTGAKQLGHEVFSVRDGRIELDLDRATMKTLWDNYYVPMVQGWFSSEGKFRSDAVKTGDLLSYVGSSSSVVYFPQTVTVDDRTSYPIEVIALPAPTFENGVPCAPQQGAGFVVTKADERTECACVEFLTWFTAKEQNAEFAVEAGYLPVTKEAIEPEFLKEVALSLGNSSRNYAETLPAALETMDAGLYRTFPAPKGSEARSVLGKSLFDRAVRDQAAVRAQIEAGADPAEAVAAFLDESVFDAWLTDLKMQLEAVVA